MSLLTTYPQPPDSHLPWAVCPHYVDRREQRNLIMLNSMVISW
jgi:hypothetical protein